MALQSDIARGLRDRLLASGIPRVTVGDLPRDEDRVVSVTPSPLIDEQTTGVSWLRIRVLIRRPTTDGPTAAYDDQDAVYNVLTALSYADVGGHIVASVERNRSAEPKPDGTGRQLIADTYYLTTNRPS